MGLFETNFEWGGDTGFHLFWAHFFSPQAWLWLRLVPVLEPTLALPLKGLKSLARIPIHLKFQQTAVQSLFPVNCKPWARSLADWTLLSQMELSKIINWKVKYAKMTFSCLDVVLLTQESLLQCGNDNQEGIQVVCNMKRKLKVKFSNEVWWMCKK